MNQDRLIKHCICGNENNFSTSIKNNIEILECAHCGVIHQLLESWDEEKYSNFYKNDYHIKFQESKQLITYKQRYEHDCKVARIRLNSYKEFLTLGMKGLDIGSSNSAFVHEANNIGFNCIGLEPGYEIGDNDVTIRGTLQSANLDHNSYDFITMHDSIEHMVDINLALKKISNIIKSNRFLIVDLPDYFVEQGQHHWKYIEHLWFFTKEQFINLLNKFSFSVEKVTQPIPGKLVFYARKL